MLDHPKFKSAALWVKSNSRALNVLAGSFFFFTFIAGLAWLAGAKADAVAYVLSLCASTLFGLPHLAEFILPSRKAVKDMNHDELLQLVLASDPKRDWHGISRQWVSEFFLKEDPRLRFRAQYTEDGMQNDNYQDAWANRHPHRHAVGYWHDLYYDGNLIDRFILVSVDGARAMVPPPDWQTGRIHQLEYRVGQIHDSLESLDQYIRRSGLEVDHEA